MKKYFALLLACILLFAGCANGDADQTENTGPDETTPMGYYEANSQLEKQTNGAVRQYPLPDASYTWIKSIGDRILLATNTNPAMLSLLSGEECVPVTTVQVNGELLENCEALFNGFFCYDASAHAVVVMDPQLNQTQQIPLPAEAETPVISQSGDQIYYSQGQEIRALDTSKKLTRLVKTLSVTEQKLIGTCFEGKILVCETKDSEGKTQTLYISTENGQTLKTENNIQKLYTYQDRYLAERMDGTVPQLITGTLDGDVKQLNIEDSYWASALEIGGAVGYSSDEAGLHLNYYDLSSGLKTAAVTLEGVKEPQWILADRWSGHIWILVSNDAGNGMRLLRWNVKQSPVTDETQYVGTLFTAENPDAAALEEINSRISSLNKKYGVRIRVWKEAVKSPGNHTLEIEHQISAITEMLDQLQPVLAEFPKSFISKSISSKVRICLVRSVDGETKGLQYWDGSYAFIALSTGVDVRSEFIKAFGSVIDSHVLGNSAKYDYWDTLNPEGFAYGSDADESLTAGENRAFVDVESMVSGTMDRSRVFWQAMLPDNAEMFKSETMQNKLKMLCQAIRDAWNTKKSTDVFPWEQYLTKPIAKKK